jgi:hypothetical protein
LPSRRLRVLVAELEHAAAELHACGRPASTASIVPSGARWKAAARPAVAEDLDDAAVESDDLSERKLTSSIKAAALPTPRDLSLGRRRID